MDRRSSRIVMTVVLVALVVAVGIVFLFSPR